MLNLSFQEAADRLYGSNAFLKSKIRSDLRILWPKNDQNTVLQRNRILGGFFVRQLIFDQIFQDHRSINTVRFMFILPA